MNHRPDFTESSKVRARLAERFFQLAREKQCPPAERRELLRMARSWARTLPEGPERDRILSLDERQG